MVERNYLVNICRQISQSLYSFLSLGEVTKIITGLWKFSLRVGVTFCLFVAYVTNFSMVKLLIFPKVFGRKKIILTVVNKIISRTWTILVESSFTCLRVAHSELLEVRPDLTEDYPGIF